MAQCLMSIFHLITIQEDIVVLHMYNILKIQVAYLMQLLPHCCHLRVKYEIILCSYLDWQLVT